MPQSPEGSPRRQVARRPSCVSPAQANGAGSSASLATLTSELSQCLHLSYSVKTSAQHGSAASLGDSQSSRVIGTAMDEMVRQKMDMAWAVVCQRFNIPFEATPHQPKPGSPSPRKAGGKTKAGGQLASSRSQPAQNACLENAFRRAMNASKNVESAGEAKRANPTETKTYIKIEESGHLTQQSITTMGSFEVFPCLLTPRSRYHKEPFSSSAVESPTIPTQLLGDGSADVSVGGSGALSAPQGLLSRPVAFSSPSSLQQMARIHSGGASPRHDPKVYVGAPRHIVRAP